ncbi:hypothetical protein PIB30_097061 [Stylosanthes scabra]|uniref:Putative plant transposon protein domain-containing protein n=1 Tax=Stylosanthes scabra TaxID=79078 RepID=A0ABU6QVK6_9FABA|nr:hypothetical protein [Stylosanthes scabra]
MVRGKEISFAPQDIKRVLRLRKDPLPNAASYEERVANKDYRLDHVQEDLSIMPTTNGSELTIERSVLIHSIIIGENINVEEIIAKQFYKFIYKTDLASSLPFPSIIVALCADAKVPAIKNDSMIPQEPAIVGAAMLRTRETRARQARQARQEAPPPQQPPQIYRRLDQQQEESRKSFEAINTRMDRMDD